MARLQTKYVCQSCAFESTKWMGRCPECEAWDSFVEEVTLREKAGAGVRSGAGAPILAARGAGAPTPITQIEMADHSRLLTGIAEFDRVLGGGIVPGALMLVGGDPGIGKSTLLTQVVDAIGRSVGPGLYVSGEESPQQIKMRSARLNADTPGFLVSAETEIGLILHHLEAIR
ncbi:MAG TPA: ATPase domain-containing protein, partial [Chthonomonadaceae bacterium]|nr:ATPase domain-containing protein [Chthonomonadaceae bacterium]